MREHFVVNSAEQAYWWAVLIQIDRPQDEALYPKAGKLGIPASNLPKLCLLGWATSLGSFVLELPGVDWKKKKKSKF